MVRSADRILVLEEGRIREQGRHEALLAHDGLYAQDVPASKWDTSRGRQAGIQCKM